MEERSLKSYLSFSKEVLEAKEKGLKGKDVTSFLLGKVKELTEGKSLEANIELVKNNDRVGAGIAIALNQFK